MRAMLLGGRYELDEPLGTGGFSEVWRATDTVLSRPVAIKLLRGGYLQQAEAQARFKAEARYAGALCHENIARIYDYNEPADGQQPYLVMELVDGPSLASLLKTGPLDAARTMDVVAQAAAGLQVAHDAGLIHRDIKPANLLLTPSGTVKIADFGIAHAVGTPPVTLTGMLVGTPGYMAPERIAGAQATPASDLYALGVVAYECLAGAPPFSGVPLEVALAHRELPLPPLPMSVPLDVAAFVMQLTAKDAFWRPGSAAEVARRAAALRDAVAQAPRPGIPAQAPPADSAVTSADNRRLRPIPPPRRAHVASLSPPIASASPGARRPAPHAGRRRPSARAVSSIVLAGLAGLLLAGVLRLAPPLHQAGAPSVTSSGPALGLMPAHRPDAHHRGSQSADTSTRATGQSAADPAAAIAPATDTRGKPGRKQAHGHRHHGDDKQGGGSDGQHGHGHGQDPGSSNGSGGSDGSGDASAQVLSSRGH